MSLAPTKSFGSRLKTRLLVNGIQSAERSLGAATAVRSSGKGLGLREETAHSAPTRPPCEALKKNRRARPTGPDPARLSGRNARELLRQTGRRDGLLEERGHRRGYVAVGADLEVEARRGSGLGGRRDLALLGGDVGVVPAVGRQRVVGGVEEGDAD